MTMQVHSRCKVNRDRRDSIARLSVQEGGGPRFVLLASNSLREPGVACDFPAITCGDEMRGEA